MRRLIPALLLLAACHGDAQGTSIGNPNKTIITVAPPGDQVRLTSATLPLSGIEVDGDPVDVPEGTDALQGIQVDLPNWLTSVRLELDGTFDLTGTEGDAEVDLQLDLQEVEVLVLRVPFTPGEPHVFELAAPGWLDADQVGWVRGEDHRIDPESPEHDALVLAVRQGSSLLPDEDGDGVPDR